MLSLISKVFQCEGAAEGPSRRKITIAQYLVVKLDNLTELLVAVLVLLARLEQIKRYLFIEGCLAGLKLDRSLIIIVERRERTQHLALRLLEPRHTLQTLRQEWLQFLGSIGV